MPFVLRTLRKNKFVDELQPEWVPNGDIQADALKDLQTSNNSLSVWFIDDEHSQLDRLLAAMAAAKDSLSNIDFAILDVQIVQNLGLSLVENDGIIPDDALRVLHRDIVQISSSDLCQLAIAISEHALLGRKTKAEMRSSILSSIDLGYLSSNSLKPNMLNSLGIDS